MVTGLQDLREQYFKYRSIDALEIPKECRASLKLAPFCEAFPENSVIIWVVQRKYTKKGFGPPIPQPPNADPDIPEFSKGYRIPLLGNPLPRVLTHRSDLGNHYPRFDPLNPNKIIQSPEVQKAEEERLRNEAREAEIQKIAEESKKATMFKTKKKQETAVNTSSLRTSSRIHKLAGGTFTPPDTSPPSKVNNGKATTEEGELDEMDLSSEQSESEDDDDADFRGPPRMYKGLLRTSPLPTHQHPSSDENTPSSEDELDMLDSGSREPTGESPKRTRFQARFEDEALQADVSALPAPKRGQTKSTVPVAAAVQAASARGPGRTAKATTMIANYHSPSPAIPRGTKPKSRIASRRVNCGKVSSMEWRNRPGPERNDCPRCFKRRDKKM